MKETQGTESKPYPALAGAHGSAVWRELFHLPPEGVKIWVQLKSGMQCYGVRRGNTIHVGVPDAFNPEVVLWTDDPDAESPNSKRGEPAHTTNG